MTQLGARTAGGCRSGTARGPCEISRVVRDATGGSAGFRATCEAIIRARTELEDALRVEEGHEVHEEEQQEKRSMLEGIDEGLLLRSLIVAVKP